MKELIVAYLNASLWWLPRLALLGAVCWSVKVLRRAAR